MSEEEIPLVPLLAPRGGIPFVVVDSDALALAIEALSTGGKYVAVDAERASGYRYSQRAYLIQLKREDGPIILIDPIGCPDLSGVDKVLGDCEWILHASTQDLACLREVGIDPRRMFDTELGARLAGCPRVGLGPLIESLLGFSLAKEHSAVDWSTRPLPEPWLGYAALDVELLIELRNKVAELLEEQGKLAWAYEEFEAILLAPAPKPRSEPWRRTSDIHQVKKPLNQAVVRELWYARDNLARTTDIAPGRILRDSAIVEAALKLPATDRELLAIPAFNSRNAYHNSLIWLAAITRAIALPVNELPEFAPKLDALPPLKVWPQRAPAAFARLEAAKSSISKLALDLDIPIENLLAPESVRRICWEPPGNSATSLNPGAVGSFLAERGARPWQIALVGELLALALLAV
jgi:ribonuclease D